MLKVTEKPMVMRKKMLPLVMAIANGIIKDLNFVDEINKRVKWDKTHWRISPGGLAKALVLSTFADTRILLTHIQDRFEQVDLGYLIGEEAETNDINAFNTGRALERIGEADYNGLYETLALSALQKNDIPMHRYHGDTTTISFYGEYDVESLKLTEEEQAELLKIEKGYNKDGRPECKQVVVGQIVTEHGIPLVSRVMDGATSDVEWNKESIDYLNRLTREGFKSGIYVADSKLVNGELITKLNDPENKILFVSRCPASFENKLESRMIDKAYASDNWEDIGQFHEGKKASNYKGISFIESVCGSIMRLLVLESSSLAEKAEQSLEKEKDKITPLRKELEKKKFMCQADAEEEYERFKGLRKLKLFDCTYEITKDVKEKWPRGRRSKDSQPTITEPTYRIRIAQISRNEEACRQFLRNESCVVIISNAIDGTTNRDLLSTYKGQQVVENSFRLLKSPNLASVIYLKNPVRIQALTMILTFSLLIRAIIQFRLRDGLKKFQETNPNGKLHIGWGGKPLVNPTFKLLYEHSLYCYYEREARGEYSFAWPNAETKQRVTPLLALMGISVATILQ